MLVTKKFSQRLIYSFAKGRWLFVLAALILSSCSTSPPANTEDICAIFNEKSDWYEASLDSYKKWGVPIHVQMAIMHQESHFVDDAQPPRTTLFWFIPWTRPSSAYGYAQVKDDTWDWYIEKTGNSGADRDDFADAVDFIGWYGNMSHKMLGISKWDAYAQYLAYHEGQGGYKRRTYNQKPWLKKVAAKVKKNASRYSAQLKKCESELDSWSLWPF
ncbi:MAG: transglycosylase SLT domain-containing protein [gamma proteobacterium symbiont of Bathyaustriella thionipta]|nr:transglycosylase SLT domain-containing protein [gamma proteobacterium symbiont of Bathyaustriella thionipta]